MDVQHFKIGLIGLGKMGSALAKRILAAGFDLTVYNRTQSKMTPLTDAGAHASETPAECARDKDIVITSLFDDHSLIDVINGENGILTTLKSGAIHIGTTTILPTTSKLLTKSHTTVGTIYLAATVLGIPKVAEKGELTTLVAGDSKAIATCTPIFNTYSAKIINVGTEPYKANVMKLCCNYFLATAIESMGEIYTFGEKNELDSDILSNFFHSVFAHPSFKLYVDKVKTRQFDDVNFELSGGLKDMGLVQQAFTDSRVLPEIANIIKDKFIAAAANGLENKDWSSFTEMTRLQAGLKD